MNKLFLLINMIILPGMTIPAQKSMAGVFGPNGLMLLDPDESVVKKNKLISAKEVTSIFNEPTEFGEINVFFFNQPDISIRNSFYPFINHYTPSNSYKKISENEYEIALYDPSRMVLFGHGKLKEGFGIAMKLPGSGGLNATNLMGEEIDSLILTTGDKKIAYKIRSFNPFSDSLILYIRNKTNDKPVLTFRIHFHYPAPVLSGVTTDTALIQKKKMNPSFEWVDNKISKDAGHNKIILPANHNAILFAFEHFGRFRFRYLDNLQYKLDNTTDWTLTPLASKPSVLLENLSPGKHTLYARYPSAMAKVFSYEIEVKRSPWNSPLIYIPAAILFSGIIFFFIYRTRLRTEKEKAERMKLELQALQSQLNPHFIFNALNSIQYFINIHDKTRADLYLVELSKLLRYSLNNSEKELIPLSEELIMLDNYIRLEQMRFHFHYEKAVDKELETETLPVPPLLLQPLIENAVRHGISGMGAKGILRMEAVKENNDLVISIADNGPGIDSSKMLNGLGIQIVKNRVKVLTKRRYDINLAFQTGNPGTIVTIRFKNWI
jgi:hypothetical protein